MLGRVFSHYRIIEKLGQGGMGEVYLAEDLFLQRFVALKFLPEYLEEHPLARERFLAEAKSAAALDHPFLCHIYEAGEWEGRSFIAMEYLEGQTLKERLGEGPLTVSQALKIVSDVAEGLEVAHRKGIIHRDLKPANIMLMTDGHAKVMDFGVAKAEVGRAPIHLTSQLKGQNLSGAVIAGTFPYMSPEQIAGQEGDSRSDIFALGIVLREMLSGVHGLEGNKGAASPSGQRSAQPRSLPEGLERIVEKALKETPEDRFSSMRDFLEELEPLMAAEALPEFGARLRRREWLAWGLGVSLVLVLVSAIAYVAWVGFFPGRSLGTERMMLAVLPFHNLNGNDGQDYFSDGLTEEMISRLSGLQPENLGVIARSSIMRFKGSNEPIGRIASELRVDYVLEGSLRRQGDRIRVTTTLIRSTDEAAIWSESYDRELDDVFALQTEVARKIAEALALELLPVDEAERAKNPTNSTEAYEAYLRGRFHWNKRTADGLQRALEYFDTAVRLDPGYAAAYAGIADTYSMMASYLILPESEAFSKATQAALKSVEIDDSSVEAHTALAGIWGDQWDWKKAEAEYNRAIELNPAYSLAHQWYSELLSLLGRHEESLRESEAARELDPLSVIANTNVGHRLLRLERFDEATRVLEQTLELDPDFGPAYLHLGTIQLMSGHPEEAIKQYQIVLQKAPRDEWALASLGHVFASIGKSEEMQEVIRELEAIAIQRKGTAAWFLAVVEAGSGNRDRVFYWLDQALAVGERRTPLVKTEPTFDGIRDDPRYITLLGKMNLSP